MLCRVCDGFRSQSASLVEMSERTAFQGWMGCPSILADLEMS